MRGVGWGFGCTIASVAIERDTGQVDVRNMYCVDDAGVLINPLLAAGQVIGGVAQGLGEALMERVVYDDEGQLLTASFVDYAIPRADHMPMITVESRETPSPVNALGAKGIGEAGSIGAPAAIMNAALDAVAPLGIDHLEMPLTGETVWRAIHDREKRIPSA
jgi:carbon-monoxide dehydrogenase large subunit